MKRKTFLRGSLAAAASVIGVPRTWAAEFPDRPVKLVIPFAVGGAMDAAARVLLDKMASRLGQPVIIDNRPGAAGTVGGGYVAKGPKDGYNIYFGTSSSLGYSKLLQKDQTYDPVQDFTPVAMVGSVPVGYFLNAGLGINTFQEFIAAAKAQPGRFSYVSSGQMGMSHLAGELLAQRAGIELLHVPYAGAAARYWADLLGGQISMVIAGVTLGLPLAQDGRVKFLAIATRERSPRLPNVPAVGEFYPGFDVPAWFGFAVARGTPPEIVAKLEAATLGALREPSTRVAFEAAGVDIDPILGAKAFEAKIPADIRMWEEALTKAGLIK